MPITSMSRRRNSMSNEFFDNELDRMKTEEHLDTVRVNEYKEQFARQLQGVKKASLISATEINPKPRKKPFRIRFREFLNRLMGTIS